jgi:hypothetical protein
MTTRRGLRKKTYGKLRTGCADWSGKARRTKKNISGDEEKASCGVLLKHKSRDSHAAVRFWSRKVPVARRCAKNFA